MKQRNLAAVFLLPFVTFGIYGLYWMVSTKNELNRRGASIPTAWLLIIPFVSLYWTWKYSEAVSEATNEKISGVLSFVLLVLLGIVGPVILQNEFNKLGDAAAAPVTPATPYAQPQPDNSFGGPVSVAPVAPVMPAAPAVPVLPTTPTPTAAPVAPAGQVITPTNQNQNQPPAGPTV